MKLWGGKKNKGFRSNDRYKPRNGLSSEPNQRVISYYTASRRQLDNFERNSNIQKDDMMHKRQARRLRQSWFGIFMVIALLVIFGYLITLSSSPHLVLKGDLYRSTAQYQAITTTVYGHDFRDRFKPLLNYAGCSRSSKCGGKWFDFRS